MINNWFVEIVDARLNFRHGSEGTVEWWTRLQETPCGGWDSQTQSTTTTTRFSAVGLEVYLKCLSYILPPFRQSCCIIFLHPVLKETCTHFMYLYLLGASWYFVQRKIGCVVDIPVPPKMKPPNRLRQLDSPTNHIPKVQDAEMRLEVAARRFSILVLKEWKYQIKPLKQ